jgi:long-chain-fatty-acid--CoA ligase ACSBG
MFMNSFIINIIKISKMSNIIYILIALVIIVTLVYYLFYIREDEDVNRDIPYNLLYDNNKTLVSLITDVVENYGNLPAMKYEINNVWNTMTYKDYYYYVNNFARKLLYFIGPHPRVAILSFNKPEWFISHMGTIFAGGISVGLYTTASSDNCAYVINHSCIDLLIIENSKQLKKICDIKIPTVKLIVILDEIPNSTHWNFSFLKFDKNQPTDDYTELIENIKSANNQIIIMGYNQFMTYNTNMIKTNASIEIGKFNPNDTVSIIYTSGTTSDPKGVCITHKNIISAIRSSINAIRSRSNISIYIQERFVSYLPLNHIAGQIMDIYIPLATVGLVHFARNDCMKKSLIDTLKYVRPSIFVGVPRVWEKIMENIEQNQSDPKHLLNRLFVNRMIINGIGLDKCKYYVTSTAPIMSRTKNFFNDLGIELCDVYGMSETTGPISMAVPGLSKGSGIPIVNVKIDKITKEILVKGDNVFKEYYKNKEETNKVFKNKWFNTGDIGYIDRDGVLYVTGRTKDIIITSGGENVSPLIIEETLLAELNKENRYFEYAVLVGDQKKFLSVLLFPCEKCNKSKKELTELIDDVINITNKRAPNNVSTIKKYILLKDEKLEIGECLTPTLKIRRKNICDKYKNQIDELYIENEQ